MNELLNQFLAYVDGGMNWQVAILKVAADNFVLPAEVQSILERQLAEAGYLLKQQGLKKSEISAVLCQLTHVPEEVLQSSIDSLFSVNRHPATINTDELLIFFPSSTAMQGFSALASGYCQPLKKEGASVPEYDACIINNSVEQGSQVFFLDGNVAGRLVGLTTTSLVAQRVRASVGSLGLFFDSLESFKSYMAENGLSQSNPNESFQ